MNTGLLTTSFLVYRRPRAISLKNTRQAINLERSHLKAASVSTYQPPEPLLSFDDIPIWAQDNPWVRSGYRNANNSYRKCFRSCAQVHNETFNILTHLLPAIGLLLSQFTVQRAIAVYYPEATLTDRIVFGLNVFAAIITFSLSTLYHTFMCHSQQVSSLWLRIDYVGILVLILGSFFSGIHVGFFCEPGMRNVYWAMISMLSLLTATIVLHPSLQGIQHRSYKAYAFIATALTGFAPITHGMYLYGWSEMWIRSGMPFWFLEGIIYAIGAVFFISRFPESSWPGYFDIYFNSHSIFHALVVCASFVHMYGVWYAYVWNYEHSLMCRAPYGST